MKSRSITGAGGTAEVVAGTVGETADCAGADAWMGGGLGGAAGLGALRCTVALAAPAPLGDALGAAAGAVAGRTFCAAAARALAQLARLGASSFGAAVSDFVIEAVEA
ncbi:MAG: hypothetical protein ACTHL7_00695, partial [Steroidobacteraceae bacterium]